MKNVQIIDAADNCSYPIYKVTEKEFEIIFPDGQDVEFIEDLYQRINENVARKLFNAIWQRRVDKRKIQGIQGTLFYQLAFKKKYYPTKKENEMINGFNR